MHVNVCTSFILPPPIKHLTVASADDSFTYIKDEAAAVSAKPAGYTTLSMQLS